MTKEIAKLIVLAQASSDVGKGICELYDFLPARMKSKAAKGYYMKDTAIRNLLAILSKHPQKDVHFFVCEDQDKVADYIIYFDFMLAERKVQVSFHSYDKFLKRYVVGSRKSCTSWKETLVSREMAFLLAKQYGLLCRKSEVSAAFQ